jgi:hypothetical protein
MRTTDPAVPASLQLPDFLPGRLFLTPGNRRDYLSLEPATWAAVWSVRYQSASEAPTISNDLTRVVAVGVLSYPVPSCLPRERFLGRTGFTRKQNLRFANENVRTISRVVVHPQFRSLGLSTILVRRLCQMCDTRYVESLAVMARAHPFLTGPA